MYLRASEMSKQAWSEAVKTNNLEEHMLLDPLFVSINIEFRFIEFNKLNL